ncbi:MAG: type II secretion system F family protein [Parcubacteria group bacterium]|jgi:type IV pilus assembly protein PilC
MKFNFKAKTQTGEYKEGVINASSKELAVTILQKNNLLPISVQSDEPENDFMKVFLKYYDRVTEKELVIFFRQLAILIEARVPIVTSLSAIKEQTSNEYLVKIVREMINDIEDGMSFSGSMEKHKDVFSNLSINIIKAGETSGNLKKSVDYVAENIERNYNLFMRVKSALTYPAMVLIVFLIIGFLVVSFIIPKLTAIIKEMNADVPWYTQVVITVGDFMAVYWWAIAIITIAFISGAMYYLNTEEGKKEWDQIKIKLPIVGPIFRYVYITRFAENLNVLLTGGIPIIRALTIVSSVINNVVYENIFLAAAEEVKRGGNMSTVLKKSSDIPPMVTHMIKIGEESGQIDSVLGHIAKFYDQETEIMTKNLSTLLEPILMVIIGIAVGFMAFAILMPIYNIAGQIK